MAHALRVLIVGNHSTQATESAVRACGGHAFSASSTQDTLSLMGSSKVDLLLLDLDAGPEDGIKVVRSLVQHNPLVPIVVMSESPCAEFAPTALDAGAYDYIPKPLDERMLKGVLHRAELGLSGRRAEEALREKDSEMVALHHATNTIAASLEPDAVLADILTEATRMLHAERASVLLRDEATGNLYFLAATDGICELADLSVPMDSGFASWVVNHNEPVLSNDAPNDSRFYSGIDQILCYKTRSLVAAPLRANSRVIGAIEVINKIGSLFEEHDLFLLQALAMSAAIALRNARLYREQLEGRDLLRAVLSSTSSGMVVIDSQGQILFMNPAAVNLLGLDPEGVKAGNVIDLLESCADGFQVITPAGSTREDYVQAALEATDLRSFLLQIQLSEERILDAIVAPVRFLSDEILARLLVWRDVTQETEIARWRDELSQIIIHDLRNPLGLVRVGIEAAQLFLPAETSQDSLQGLSLALQGVAQLERRTEILLAVNQLESGLPLSNVGSVSLGDAVRAACSFYAFEAQERRILVKLDLPEDLSCIQGDREIIEWVVGNLLYYALKHSPRPGEIFIRARDQQDGILIRIHNPALQFPPDAAENLFAKHSPETRRPGIGTSGVGLYFCRLGAQAHSGDVRLQPGPEGCSFELWLPKAPIH